MRQIKINYFYESNLQQMSDQKFRRYIRMNRCTFHRICQFVSGIRTMNSYMKHSRIELGKIMAMTCIYLGSKMTTLA